MHFLMAVTHGRDRYAPAMDGKGRPPGTGNGFGSVLDTRRVIPVTGANAVIMQTAANLPPQGRVTEYPIKIPR